MIAIFYSGLDKDQIARFTEVFPDAALFISSNLIKPFVTATTTNSSQANSPFTLESQARTEPESFELALTVVQYKLQASWMMSAKAQAVFSESAQEIALTNCSELVRRSCWALANIYAHEGQADQALSM